VEPLNHNNEERETEEGVSLGELLKKSREERQIELDEAFRITRIRRHTLEALENERWDELPSQVFVKGFLKAYAEFLGLDKKRVLELYERISLHEENKPELSKQAHPQRKRRPLNLILALLALGFITSIAFLSQRDISIVDKAFQYLGGQEPVKEEKEAAVREERENQAEADEEEDLITRESVEETDLIEVAPIDQQEKEKPLSPRFTLTANVKNRTWIAIYVDDQPIKEYLFQPGETYTWEAHKGFDILVGNAGGIDFSLNGTEIGTLGDEGKVVRVKLPKKED